MKEFILSLLKKLANVGLVFSLLSSVAGILASVVPELTVWLGEQGVPTEWLGTITMGLVGVASSGTIIKYASTALSKVTALNKSELERKLSNLQALHQAELDNIKSTQVEELQIFTSTVNDLINNVKTLTTITSKVLDVQAITAKRNVASNLVSDEDKALYLDFLKNVTSTSTSMETLQNIYTSITVVEAQPEQTEEVKDIISEKLEEM